MGTSDELEDIFHDFLKQRGALDLFVSVHKKTRISVRETLKRPAGMWIVQAMVLSIYSEDWMARDLFDRLDNSWKGVVRAFRASRQ